MNPKSSFVTVSLIALLVLGGCIAPMPAPSASAPATEETMQEAATGEETTGEAGMQGEESSDEMMAEGTHFRVRIENLSGSSAIATPFSPGVWLLHSEPGPIFLTGEANRGLGLEAQAEDGNPADLDAALEAAGATHGLFTMPVGATERGPARPGDAFEFEVVATPDEPNLSFTSMFGQSNDLFIAPDENGIALFDAGGNPISADVTDQVYLWDAGSEQNEEPGAGANQAPRQPQPNTGPADEDNTVRLVNDMYTYPPITELIRVTVEPVDMMD